MHQKTAVETGHDRRTQLLRRLNYGLQRLQIPRLAIANGVAPRLGAGQQLIHRNQRHFLSSSCGRRTLPALLLWCEYVSLNLRAY
jgi:hypothetical protein